MRRENAKVIVFAALSLVLTTRCRAERAPPPSPPEPARSTDAVAADAAGSCGALDCRQFASLAEAFASTLVDGPRVVAVGEAHAQKDTQVASSARHFTLEVLPLLAGRASDLIVELLDPPSGCAETADAVRQQQTAVTRSQAPSDQAEYVAMGTRARALGIIPDLLRPSCADLDAVKAAGEDAISASLTLIARLTRVAVAKLVDRDARSEADARKFVVTYGGALHNDPEPTPARAEWSFGPALSDYVGGRYVAVELYVPELIDDADAWKRLPFYEVYVAARTRPGFGLRTTVYRQDKTFFIILPERGGR